MLSLLLIPFVKRTPEGRFKLRQGGWPGTAIFVLAGGGGLLLGLGTVTLAVHALLWLLQGWAGHLTPAWLAAISLALGAAPWLLAAVGLGRRPALGLVGMGLGTLGLLVSAVWALLRWLA